MSVTVPSAAVLAMDAAEILTVPGISVDAPNRSVLAKPVVLIVWLLAPIATVGLPSVAVEAIAETPSVYAELSVGAPRAAVDARPVGLKVTVPGANVGDPNAAVEAMPVTDTL